MTILDCDTLIFQLQGIRLISGLIDEYSLDVVQAYMAHIQVLKINTTKKCFHKFLYDEASDIFSLSVLKHELYVNC